MSHKIDVIVALAMAVLGAVKEGQKGEDPFLKYIERDLARVEETKNRCAKCSKQLIEGEGFAQSRGLKFCSVPCSW